MKFSYQIRTKTGEIQSGVIEASSKEAALDLLQQGQYFVTLLEETGGKPFYAKKVKLFGGVSQKDLVIFARQLSLMFKSRIPLNQSLRTLAEQMKNQEFKETIFTISEEVEAGTAFSQALTRFPKIFSSFFISMVKSGEASGTLSESLNYLADHLEADYELTSKLKGAMVYPAMIVIASVGVLMMMMFFVIPNLARVLTETGQELPFVTKIVIGLSDFLRSKGWVLLIISGITIFAARRYLKTQSGSIFKDKTLLKVPAIGQFLKIIYISRFAENLSTLITGGLPITDALEITGQVVGNVVYKDIIAEIQEEVRKGREISSVLRAHPGQFPPLLFQMVLIGEKTGTLDQTLKSVVNFYQKEVARSMESLLSLIEPIMIIILGAMVAGLMGSVLLPLYKLTSV